MEVKMTRPAKSDPKPQWEWVRHPTLPVLY